eukprot:5390020-Prymnesium_polylepis.1
MPDEEVPSVQDSDHFGSEPRGAASSTSGDAEEMRVMHTRQSHKRKSRELHSDTAACLLLDVARKPSGLVGATMPERYGGMLSWTRFANGAPPAPARLRTPLPVPA